MKHYWPVQGHDFVDIASGAKTELVQPYSFQNSPDNIYSAIRFEGGYAKIAPGVYMEGGDFTFSLWINIDKYNSRANLKIQSRDPLLSFRSKTHYFDIVYHSEDDTASYGPALYYHNAIGLNSLMGSAPIPAGQWHHFTFTTINKTMTFYMDGNLVSSGASYFQAESFDKAFTDINYIARSTSPSRTNETTFGIFDDIKLLNRGLSAKEVGQNQAKHFFEKITKHDPKLNVYM